MSSKTVYLTSPVALLEFWTVPRILQNSLLLLSEVITDLEVFTLHWLYISSFNLCVPSLIAQRWEGSLAPKLPGNTWLRVTSICSTVASDFLTTVVCPGVWVFPFPSSWWWMLCYSSPRKHLLFHDFSSVYVRPHDVALKASEGTWGFKAWWSMEKC